MITKRQTRLHPYLCVGLIIQLEPAHVLSEAFHAGNRGLLWNLLWNLLGNLLGGGGSGMIGPHVVP